MAIKGFALINEDLLQNILSRLPARSFSYAACVSKSWNIVCNRILSRPKLLSAFSLNPSSHIATVEVLEKVLSEPIRPDFVIANIGGVLNLKQTTQLILERLGAGVPVIVSRVAGIIGRDVYCDEFREIKWGDANSNADDELVPIDGANSGILLTVGFVPGLKVDAIPLLRSRKEPQAKMVDKFVMDIRSYVSTVSDYTAPLGIILFGNEDTDVKLAVEKLDYAMPTETVIVGDESSQFLYKGGSDGRNFTSILRSHSDAVALVFAKDRNKPHGIGEIQFHVALSNGLSAIGPRYKAVAVRVTDSDSVTWLTARREGELEILDGQQILNDISNELEDGIICGELYVGVTKRRNFSIGSEKQRPITSMAFHNVMGGDEEYLYAVGVGIKTGDYFRIYQSDPDAALSSSSNATVELRNLKLDWNSKVCSETTGVVDSLDKKEAFGGFIFSCCGRGKSFFRRFNVDSSPFLDNFPGMPLAGIFCCGEIGRDFTSSRLEESRGGSVHCCMHVYSTVYLLMSYSPARANH
ncbi:F-box/LRR-repeat protein At5g63520 [Carica papaya]|uniref:F-box/LRR-repeat protein At5g63520 n=1 Tax=Carica papaya TaxID=3649 RepID=UPI000B8CEAE8|nr:F-box/LRR-repeat protein At5g63520 [Carica papaya]